MSAFRSLSEAMRLIVASSRLFSILPFSISQDTRNRHSYIFGNTVTGFIIGIVKAGVEFVIAYIMFSTLYNVYQYHKSTANLFLVLIYSMANVLAGIHEIYETLNQKQVVEALNDLQFVDNELTTELNIFPNNKNIVPLATGFALFTTILWGSLVSMHELIFMDTFILWAGFMLPYMMMFISTSHFFGLVVLIGQRFQLLNENLREIVNYMNKLNKFGITPSGSDMILGIQYRLCILQRLRETLVQISSKVNGAYSVQLLMMFTTYFAVFVQKVHRLMIIQNDTTLTLANSAYVVLWVSTIGLVFVAVCLACTKCTSDAKSTAKILLTLEPQVQNSYMRIFLEQFLMRLLHSNVNFTVCDLFSINSPLLLAMTSTITGYIVLCVQFSKNL